MSTCSAQVLFPCSQRRSSQCSSMTQPSQVDLSLECKHGFRFFLKPGSAQEEAHLHVFDICFGFAFLKRILLDSVVLFTSPLGIRMPYRNFTAHSAYSNHLRQGAFACRKLSDMPSSLQASIQGRLKQIHTSATTLLK